MKNHLFQVKLFLVLITCIASFSANAICLGDQSNLKPFKVYVVPQLTATQIYTRWGPLLEILGNETGLCFELVVPTSIPQFEDDLLNGKPDFAYMNPYHVVMKWRGNKYIPLVASSDLLYGNLVVNVDEKIKSLKDIEGGQVAFPAPNAFAASLLIRATLAKEGIKVSPVYVKTHSNVYRSVVRSDVVAGGGIHSTLAAEPAELRSRLRVLLETKKYASHPFTAHSRVPENIRTKIQNAMIALDKSSDGSDLLKNAQLNKPMLVNYKSHYQPLETLNLEKFVVKSAE